jgi:hypothetical protein
MIKNALRLTGLAALLMNAEWQPAGAASFDGSVAISGDRHRDARGTIGAYAVTCSNCSASEKFELPAYFACPLRII